MFENKKYNNSITFLDGLTLLFVGLKLTGYINWSWWWVLSPLWIPVCIVIIVVLLIMLWKM